MWCNRWSCKPAICDRLLNLSLNHTASFQDKSHGAFRKVKVAVMTQLHSYKRRRQDLWNVQTSARNCKRSMKDDKFGCDMSPNSWIRRASSTNSPNSLRIALCQYRSSLIGDQTAALLPIIPSWTNSTWPFLSRKFLSWYSSKLLSIIASASKIFLASNAILPPLSHADTTYAANHPHSAPKPMLTKEISILDALASYCKHKDSTAVVSCMLYETRNDANYNLKVNYKSHGGSTAWPSKQHIEHIISFF